MIRAVCFDVDDTLVDYATALFLRALGRDSDSVRAAEFERGLASSH